MFGDLMGKIGDMKSKMNDVKTRLGNITVTGESIEAKVIVSMDGNKVMKDVQFNMPMTEENKEEISDLFIQASNRAIEQAEKMYEAEMAASAKDFLPGLGM